MPTFRRGPESGESVTQGQVRKLWRSTGPQRNSKTEVNVRYNLFSRRSKAMTIPLLRTCCWSHHSMTTPKGRPITSNTTKTCLKQRTVSSQIMGRPAPVRVSHEPGFVLRNSIRSGSGEPRLKPVKQRHSVSSPIPVGFTR